jgi:hypothetical protein
MDDHSTVPLERWEEQIEHQRQRQKRKPKQKRERPAPPPHDRPPDDDHLIDDYAGGLPHTPLSLK